MSMSDTSLDEGYLDFTGVAPGSYDVFCGCVQEAPASSQRSSVQRSSSTQPASVQVRHSGRSVRGVCVQPAVASHASFVHVSASSQSGTTSAQRPPSHAVVQRGPHSNGPEPAPPGLQLGAVLAKQVGEHDQRAVGHGHPRGVGKHPKLLAWTS